MLGYVLAHATLWGAAGSLTVCGALLIFSGLLGPLEPRTRRPWKVPAAGRSGHEPPPKDVDDRPEDSPMSLNAIELALIAELNIERARDHDAVANDAARLPEVRLAAEAAATAWRERARMFQIEAARRSRQPMVPPPGEPAPVMDFSYTGPERRRQMRRRHARRGDEPAASQDRDRRDRRMGSERRRRDRRRPELAAR